MFGSLKEKLIGRKKHNVSHEDIRSHVINEKPPGFERKETIREKYNFADPASPEFHEMPGQALPPLEEGLGEPRSRSLGARPEPEDFGPRERGFGGPRREASKDYANNYDVLDRLNLIESQLAAIRSQTETINERLKNMETRLVGRRY